MLQGWEWKLGGTPKAACRSRMLEQWTAWGGAMAFRSLKNRLAMVDQLLRQSPVLFSTPCYGLLFCSLMFSFCPKSETDPNTFFFCMHSNLQATFRFRGCKKGLGVFENSSAMRIKKLSGKVESWEIFFSEGIPFGGHGGNPALMERT